MIDRDDIRCPHCYHDIVFVNVMSTRTRHVPTETGTVLDIVVVEAVPLFSCTHCALASEVSDAGLLIDLGRVHVVDCDCDNDSFPPSTVLTNGGCLHGRRDS